ncbi:restriction endonuclease subunit S [Mycolicibacterium thermoresistibile]
MRNWRATTLGDLEKESNGVIQTGPFGSQLHKSDYTPSGTPVVMPTNIRDLRVDTANIARVSADHVERLARHKLRAGDIVYSRRGDVEKCALIRPDEAGWLCGTGCLLVRVGGEQVDPRFLSYSLSQPDTRAWISGRAVGATMPNLNTDILREVPVLLPTIDEQRGIAATLGALDDKIDSNRRTIALMEELALTHFTRLFDIDLVEGGVAVSDLVRVNPRRALAKGVIATYVPMSSLPEFSAEIFEWEKREAGSGQRFMNGDVLMARITPCLENGKTAVVDMLGSEEVGWGSTEYVVLAPQGDYTTAWIYCLVRSEAVRSFMVRSMTGTSGRQRFHANRFDQYRITQPAKTSLQAFNDITTPMFEKMTQLRDEIICAQDLRDALLPELLSSRIRVPEANEAVAEVVA